MALKTTRKPVLGLSPHYNCGNWPLLTAALDWISGWRGTRLVVWLNWGSLPSMMLDSWRWSSSFPESYASTLYSCRWPVIVIISDFGTPLAFSFLTTVFRTEWLDNLLSGHISCKGEFSFIIVAMILLIAFLPIRLFLYQTSVLVWVVNARQVKRAT